MPSEVADVMLPNAQSTPWPKEDARETWGALPMRKALAAVLGALTTEPEAWWREKIAAASRRDAVRVRSDSVDVFVPRPSGRPGTTHQRLWSFSDPDEASEVLLARSLLPAGWSDFERHGWVCGTCEGSGWKVVPLLLCGTCNGTGVCEVPERGVADLVAVASLGVPALLRYEALAREASLGLREHGCPSPDRVVWRVAQPEPRRVVWRSPRANNQPDARWAPAEILAPGVFVAPHSRAKALWDAGVALHGLTEEAVSVVVPPLGGSDG